MLQARSSAAASSSAADPEVLATTARTLLDNLQKQLGKPLTKENIKPFRDHSDTLLELEKSAGPDLIAQVRIFVKGVGPLLGKPEYGEDASLHTVLMRADDLLGLADDADQDTHPYIKGRIISQTIRKLTEQIVIAFNARLKDEL